MILSTGAFSPTFATQLLLLADEGHYAISQNAILKIAYEYLDVKTLNEFIQKLGLISFNKRLSAVSTITTTNGKVDDDRATKNRPSYHFDAEMFVLANNLLINSQELILNSIRSQQFSAARQQLSTYLHTLQDFYSHSNYIEMDGIGAFRPLGEANAFQGRIVTVDMATCSNCTSPCDLCNYVCVDNINPSINQHQSTATVHQWILWRTNGKWKRHFETDKCA
ncbi:unnamed protein product [Didymodactylos carnosus]|uniref:VWA7 N-terminal domain-containing protein n=1 Tax=Didymodactylos carnosus TaxID=1234261 RepID=A0A815U1K7_9BILA|nr:unnamed protein product [Didymodactylos carnosus]CAF1509728.1 unnamed protein product [Didymodactylos carnosus]CAF4170062.1 unnamed protein product [Didymodactylos carnosus]CAF4370510.1 unnamed protein product [Didymodactylos carnosus]